MAKLFGKICREYGALEYVECIADDVKKGKTTSFPRSVKLKSNETVIFSYVVYKSRAHRDSVNKKVMKDARLAKMMNPKKHYRLMVCECFGVASKCLSHLNNHILKGIFHEQ